MASTQKKTTKGKKAPPKPEPPAYNGMARLVGGIVCLLLALCVLVSYFNVDALLLTFIAKALKGTLGCGYYLAAPALLGVAIIQLRHQGRPVILRTTCTLLVPLLGGVLWHLIFCRAAYELGGGLLSLLWKDGQTLDCGGVVAGGLALGSEALVSKVVSIILFVVLLLAALLGALHMTPQQAVDKMREYRDSRWDDEDGEDDLPDDFEPLPRRRASSAPEKPVKEKPARKRTDIDIPLNGEPSAMESGEKKAFFTRKSDTVRTPDQVLEQKAAPEPAPTVQEAVPVKEPVPAKTKKAQLQQEVESAAQEVSQAIEQELAQGEEAYRYPPITLLEENHADNCTEVGAELRNNSRRLAEALRSFGVDAAAGDVVHGPSVTRYEFTLEQGVKLSKITNLSDDIALALGASGVRVAPVPNKISVVGIEVPNKLVSTVRIRDVIDSLEFHKSKSRISFAVGKDISGKCIIGDIAKLPHMLIAGTTGSGKSVMINSIITTLLMRALPEDVRLIMVDPKRVELAGYNGLPHLYVPVVTEPKQAASALQWAVSEMERRLKVFERLNVRKISTYNEKQAAGEFEHYDNPPQKMPYLVIIIDELSDLMMVAGKDVEASIVRIAQLGRAAGIHLIVATQRPSSNVVTGLIKANITNRIAFNVATGIDSRVIIDQMGAEKLTGLGDMLFSKVDWGKPRRIQGCFVSDDEINEIVEFVKSQSEPDYHEEILSAVAPASMSMAGGGIVRTGVAEPQDDDPLIWEAAHIVVESQLGSTSGLQRRLKVGYARAGRIMDMLEEKGVVGPPDGSKPREVLLDDEGLAALESVDAEMVREDREFGGF